ATTDPDHVDRSTNADDHTLVSELLGRALPGLNPIPSRIEMCMVTRSADNQFIVGRPHADSLLVVGGGDSGHAFKHAPGLGELIAQIVTGEPTYVDTAFIDPQRFHGNA
ncbi:MAG: FAD-dependent oxidoreductase, partial [Geodermatophilaceae bacterium]|nr:FAD-dependent oxidoreductase [Geodermatophilaceae bacterium]